jgi:hypothetical protein
LRLDHLDQRLQKTSTETRLSEFRGEMLKETRLLHQKLDLLINSHAVEP